VGVGRGTREQKDEFRAEKKQQKKTPHQKQKKQHEKAFDVTVVDVTK
jgi:hypothetical protein